MSRPIPTRRRMRRDPVDPLSVWVWPITVASMEHTSRAIGVRGHSGASVGTPPRRNGGCKNSHTCHMPDGSGRIGPSLIGNEHHYDRFSTDKGIFEIIYGGATGAMQPFGKRLKQDEILKVIAYVRSVKKKEAGQSKVY